MGGLGAGEISTAWAAEAGGVVTTIGAWLAMGEGASNRKSKTRASEKANKPKMTT